VWGFPLGEEAPDFLPRLNALGYDTAAFSPVHYHGEQDQSTYRAVGFQREYVPDQSLTSYEDRSSWRAERKNADLATLHLLESSLKHWNRSGRKFVAAFSPQIAHFPYPDNYPPDSTKDIRVRTRAILAIEDSWLGELMDLLQSQGALDKTIIVVVGDHGRRNRLENPNLSRGTVDETAYHVPLIIYAPRALDHTERIPWITSHIDIAPTVLDLLGIATGRESEQGSPIWNSGLADRTTFLLGQPTFGADGYVSGDRFYMWNYLSDSVYANSRAFFKLADFVDRNSPLGRDVKANIKTLLTIEGAWHNHFAQPADSMNETALASGSK